MSICWVTQLCRGHHWQHNITNISFVLSNKANRHPSCSSTKFFSRTVIPSGVLPSSQRWEKNFSNSSHLRLGDESLAKHRTSSAYLKCYKTSSEIISREDPMQSSTFGTYQRRIRHNSFIHLSNDRHSSSSCINWTCPVRGYSTDSRATTASSSTGLRVEALPRVCLHDVPTQILVSGATPYAPLTLQLQLWDAKGVEFWSVAHYVSNASGTVDVTQAPSMGGSYKNCFPAGLLTTLSAGSGKHSYRRFNIADTAQPLQMTLSVYAGHLHREDCQSAVAAVELERHIRGPGVQRVEVEHGRVRGALYVPAGPGPHPAVIDMFGGAIYLAEHRSALLASHGIMSLSLPFFGYRDLPRGLLSLQLEYFEEAVDYLLSQPTAIPDRCGVVAICQGGAYGIVMGTYLDRVKAVFLINAPSVLYGTVLTHRGQAINDAVNLASKHMIFDENDNAVLNPELGRQWFNPDSGYTIPIEKSSSDTFYSINVGEYDPLHGPLAASILKTRLGRVGNTNYEGRTMNGAGHFLEPPYGQFVDRIYTNYWPNMDETHRGPKNAIYLSGAGSAEANCHAQTVLWQDMQRFIWHRVRDNSQWYQSYLKKWRL